MRKHDIARRIDERLVRNQFGGPLMQNDFRGIWIEYAVAQALGDGFKVVGQDWHAWDVQSGESEQEFPERIRIQVKNTSRTQTWNERTGVLSECRWSLKRRNKPNFFDTNNPGVPCEPYGFLCDAFVLCCHPEDEWGKANHRDLDQWDFYVLPVTSDLSPFLTEIPDVLPARAQQYTVTPSALQAGIAGRLDVEPVKAEPVKFGNLTESYVLGRLDLGI
jgi:hypothetical protein